MSAHIARLQVTVIGHIIQRLPRFPCNTLEFGILQLKPRILLGEVIVRCLDARQCTFYSFLLALFMAFIIGNMIGKLTWYPWPSR